MSSRRINKIAIGLASVVGALVIMSAVANADNDGTAKPSPAPNAAPSAPAEKTPLQEFQACVAKGGTVSEKDAVKHVVKLAGMDDWNGVLDNPKAWTDWKGGIAHASDANLIASAFAGCYKSDNGLVTVYTSDGHVAGNGRF